MPYLSTARRLQERGGTAYSGSTVLDPDVKPETVGEMSAARRTLDPFRPIYLRSAGAAPTGPPPTRSRQEELLERRGRLLEQGAGQRRRLESILERRARLLAP